MSGQGQGRWDWLNVKVEGADLVARGVRATHFGHSRDREDNGIGSGGWPVAARPDVPVVALPYRVPGHRQFKDSPLPRLAVKTPSTPGAAVRVFCPATGRSVLAELADLGPSLYVGRGAARRYLHTGIDLSEATVHALGLTLDQGVYTVDFRIVGGAGR
ncbi:MAG: hypothetical protein KF857_08615 [Fimbriimonadaceae bacterium]|nr:hypothetical protein [Fimbriimonadaceae bacterium]